MNENQRRQDGKEDEGDWQGLAEDILLHEAEDWQGWAYEILRLQEEILLLQEEILRLQDKVMEDIDDTMEEIRDIGKELNAARLDVGTGLPDLKTVRRCGDRLENVLRKQGDIRRQDEEILRLQEDVQRDGKGMFGSNNDQKCEEILRRQKLILQLQEVAQKAVEEELENMGKLEGNLDSER